MAFEFDDVSPISEIIPAELFIGNINAGVNKEILELNNIKAVLSITDESVTIPLPLSHKQITLPDSMTSNISRFFEQSNAFINNAMKPVLIHCQEGQSRSVTLAIAYLIAKKGMTLKQAYKLCQEKRSTICPNNYFMYQLYCYAQDHNECQDNIDIIFELYGRKAGIICKKYNFIGRTPTDKDKKDFVESFADCNFMWGKFYDSNSK